MGRAGFTKAGGILPGKHVPSSQPAVREEDPARSTYRNRVEQVAAEREASIMKMAEEQERVDKEVVAGGASRTGPARGSGTSGAPRATATTAGSLKGKAPEPSRPSGGAPGPSSSTGAGPLAVAPKGTGGSGKSRDATTPPASGALKAGGSGFVSAVKDPLATSLDSGPRMKVAQPQADPLRRRKQLAHRKK